MVVLVIASVTIGAIGLGPLSATTIVPGDAGESIDKTAEEVSGAVVNASSDAVSGTSATSHSGINKSEVERQFIQFLNEERSSRGLQNVSQRDMLTEMGESHSKNMATNDYFDHIQPDGTTIEDRYESRGLLPECELPIKGSDRYYPGAENIAHAYVHTTIKADWADGGRYRVSDETDLAWVLFQMWMNSKGHREAMLVYSADEAGLGIYITDNNEVFASLELC